MRMLIPFALFIGVGLAITLTTLLTNDINIHGYTELYSMCDSRMRILIAILLFVDTLYSYLTFLINVCVFVINMIYHKKQVSDYSNNLSNEFIKSNHDAESKITSIAISYSLMRDAFNETVTTLNNFFATLNFIGIIAVYYFFNAINMSNISADEIINMIIFFGVELVYIIAIQTVNTSINDISDATGSTPMVGLYFSDDDTNYTPSYNYNNRNLNQNFNQNFNPNVNS